MSNKPQHQHSDLDMSRYGLRVAAGLTEHNETLAPDIGERLRFAREQAMAKAREARAARPQLETAAGVIAQGSSLALGGGPGRGRWLKLASLLPLLLLIGGLLLIQHSQWYQQITAAAEVDAALLSDKLPPAAYGDPGFSEYLSDDEQQQAAPDSQQQPE
ncbi:DUF3619 family protein [Roseateles sp. DAIF2]|uniref:DUF3619 family protein n=1 Tax=Roseateles sp. DAIF2 TaxID=2714952 RepID=UPI0018A29FD1|nr:DUF3619 family protein [Roseateles sp. DAIF2]QPF74955.1 DUF3619 family protein [Roseateles sp. DAIF2]